MKRIVWLSVPLLLAGVAIVFTLSRHSDEDLIRGQLSRLAKAVRVTAGPGESNPLLRVARLRSEFREIFEADVRVTIPELPMALPTEPVALADSAAQLTVIYRAFDVDFSDVQIKLDDARLTAQVQATANVAATSRDGLSRDTRPVDFLLRKVDGTWRVSSINVSAKGAT